MSNNVSAAKTRKLYHRGRVSQIPIYLGKLFRLFLYQNNWIVLPMSAVIAGMIALVVRNGFGVSMEGTLKGAFAISCVAIWNGCFNSIQSICRERHIIKREHRSGMHISSYIAAHMIYQAILCLLQSALTVQVFLLVGVKVRGEGIVTQWLVLDMGISIFIISYVSDLMALLISAAVRTTTAAMTVMPFLLIFQLVFSGGIFVLPSWSNGIASWTVARHGMNCIAAQGHYNDQPMMLAWDTLKKMDSKEIVDGITVGDLVNTVGEDEVKKLVLEETSSVSRREDFASTKDNVIDCWLTLIVFGLMYSAAAMILLEFIDKDKR